MGFLPNAALGCSGIRCDSHCSADHYPPLGHLHFLETNQRVISLVANTSVITSLRVPVGGILPKDVGLSLPVEAPDERGPHAIRVLGLGPMCRDRVMSLVLPAKAVVRRVIRTALPNMAVLLRPTKPGCLEAGSSRETPGHGTCVMSTRRTASGVSVYRQCRDRPLKLSLRLPPLATRKQLWRSPMNWPTKSGSPSFKSPEETGRAPSLRLKMNPLIRTGTPWLMSSVEDIPYSTQDTKDLTNA